uniref:Alternative protein PLD5 n=1 Tax=Homo sapiens TaxID=9606 RepID=L8ECN2_HUMAN|nr:alternative protein PLD5 [Homo sapiens]
MNSLHLMPAFNTLEKYPFLSCSFSSYTISFIWYHFLFSQNVPII